MSNLRVRKPCVVVVKECGLYSIAHGLDSSLDELFIPYSTFAAMEQRLWCRQNKSTEAKSTQTRVKIKWSKSDNTSVWPYLVVWTLCLTDKLLEVVCRREQAGKLGTLQHCFTFLHKYFRNPSTQREFKFATVGLTRTIRYSRERHSRLCPRVLVHKRIEVTS